MRMRHVSDDQRGSEDDSRGVDGFRPVKSIDGHVPILHNR